MLGFLFSFEFINFNWGYQSQRDSFDGKCFFQVQKLQNIIASRATQYNHDMKRKEREYNKLKERLHQLVMNKKDKKIGKKHLAKME